MLYDRLPSRYQRAIEQYFTHGRFIKPFRRWPWSGVWKAACRHYWRVMPDEMKE